MVGRNQNLIFLWEWNQVWSAKHRWVCRSLFNNCKISKSCYFTFLYSLAMIQKKGYKRRRTTWILLVWSEHLKLHPFWLLIGWPKNCRNQTFSEVWIVSIFGKQKKCIIETFWESVGFSSWLLSFFCSPGKTFGGNPNEKLAQMTTFFEEVGLDPSKQ